MAGKESCEATRGFAIESQKFNIFTKSCILKASASGSRMFESFFEDP